MPDEYRQPPATTNFEGNPRQIGVEVELGGLPLSTVAEIVADTLDGHVVEDSPFVCRVEDTACGSIGVELDSRPLKERAYAELLGETEGSSLMDWFERSVSAAAQSLVPVEIVTAPLSLEQLPCLDPLWHRLNAAGAEGTRDSVLYAFGLHLNPDLPDVDAETVLAHLQSFLLLYDWLLREEDVDISRRVTPFIFPFPESYRRRILERGYRPSLDALIDDYLTENPSRNRALDMLPLFTHLRPEAVARALPKDNLVNARPTFHYRLPNCEIGRTGWTPANAWNRWVAVERLAADPDRLRATADEYLQLADLPLRLQASGWAERCAELVSVSDDREARESPRLVGW